jgi:hypothetical protein
MAFEETDLDTEELSREEVALRRAITNAFHDQKDVLVMVNESNACTKMSRLIPDARRRWSAVLREERYGLGVGSPDLVLVVAGRFLGLEVKRPKTAEHGAGQLSPKQKAWRDKAQRAGVVYRRVRSVEEAVAAVEEVRGCR